MSVVLTPVDDFTIGNVTQCEIFEILKQTILLTNAVRECSNRNHNSIGDMSLLSEDSIVTCLVDLKSAIDNNTTNSNLTLDGTTVSLIDSDGNDLSVDLAPIIAGLGPDTFMTFAGTGTETDPYIFTDTNGDTASIVSSSNTTNSSLTLSGTVATLTDSVGDVVTVDLAPLIAGLSSDPDDVVNSIAFSSGVLALSTVGGAILMQPLPDVDTFATVGNQTITFASGATLTVPTGSTLVGTLLTTSDGNTVDLSTFDTDTLSELAGQTISWPNGDEITIPNASSINGTIITTSDGNVLDWSTIDTDTFATLTDNTITFANGDTVTVADVSGSGTSVDPYIITDTAGDVATVVSDTDTFATFDGIDEITFADGSTVTLESDTNTFMTFTGDGDEENPYIFTDTNGNTATIFSKSTAKICDELISGTNITKLKAALNVQLASISIENGQLNATLSDGTVLASVDVNINLAPGTYTPDASGDVTVPLTDGAGDIVLSGLVSPVDVDFESTAVVVNPDGTSTVSYIDSDGNTITTSTLPAPVADNFLNQPTLAADGCTVTFPMQDGSTYTLDLCDLNSNITSVVNPDGSTTYTHNANGVDTSWTTLVQTDVTDVVVEDRCETTGPERRIGVTEGGTTQFSPWISAPSETTQLLINAGTYAAPPVLVVPDGNCKGDRLTVRALGTQYEWAEVTGTFFGSYRTDLAQKYAGVFASTFLLGGDVLEAYWNGTRWIANWHPIEMSGPSWRIDSDGYATAWGSYFAVSQTAPGTATLPILAADTGYEIQLTPFSLQPNNDPLLEGGEVWIDFMTRTTSGFLVHCRYPNLNPPSTTGGRWISHTIRPDFNAL